jgi:hypothetical protein
MRQQHIFTAALLLGLAACDARAPASPPVGSAPNSTGLMAAFPAAAVPPASAPTGASSGSGAGEIVRVLRANFDPKVSKLADFALQSGREVALALVAQDTVKGKFESQSEYTKRMRDLGSTTLFEAVRLNGVFGFEPRHDQAAIEYNADKQIFHYRLWYGSGVTLNSVEANPDDYRGETEAYARLYSRQLRHTRSVRLVITQAGNSLGNIVGQWKSPRAAAKLLDGKLAVIVVGNLVPPYSSGREVESMTDNYDGSKTADHAYELYMSLDSAWLINNETLEVLSKDGRFKRG